MGTSATRARTPALLKRLLHGPTGRAMSPTHTRKAGKLYRYYTSQDVLQADLTLKTRPTWTPP